MLKNRLKELMAEYAQEVGTTGQSALRDIMTDLRHIADDQDLDFDYADIASEEVYLIEWRMKRDANSC